MTFSDLVVGQLFSIGRNLFEKVSDTEAFSYDDYRTDRFMPNTKVMVEEY